MTVCRVGPERLQTIEFVGTAAYGAPELLEENANVMPSPKVR